MARTNSSNPHFPVHPTEKFCTQCGESKPLSGFYRRGSERNGYASECRECTKEAMRRTAAKQVIAAVGVTKKQCRDCKLTKPLADFDRSKTSKFGRRPVCKTCVAIQAKARHERNKSCPIYLQKRRRWDRLQRLKELGLTEDQYKTMHNAQNGRCAICGQPENTGRPDRSGRPRQLCVDHNHETGEVRSLLCSYCNHGIGNFRESIEFLRNAIAYLKKHSKNN